MTPKKTRKVNKRHTTVMKHLTKRWNGVKTIVEFDNNGVPKGRVIRNELYGWIGVLARNMVPLSSFSKWNHASDELREVVWQGVLVRFEVDVRHRKKLLQSAGNSWKNFKSHLTRNYIWPYKDDPAMLENPPLEEYPMLKKDDWIKFVESRLGKDFEELSKQQSERRKLNLYDHRSSRLGYEGILDILRERFGEEFVATIDRSDLWKFARTNSKGEFLNEPTRVVALRIDDLKEQLLQGTITVQGIEDILTLALGTPEHCGRVRAAGKFHTLTSYFNVPRRGSNKEKDEMLKKKDEMLKKKDEEFREKDEECKSLQAKVKELELQILSGMGGSPRFEKVASNSGKSNNKGNASQSHYQSKTSNESKRNDNHEVSKLVSKASSKRNDVVSKPSSKRNDVVSKPSSINRKEVQDCRLAIGSKSNIVAEGSVYEKKSTQDKVHHIPLGDDNVRAGITIAKKPLALLPIPIGDEILTVQDAIGTHVAWPKKLVIVVNKENDIPNNNKNNEILTFGSLVEKMDPFDHVSDLDKGVFGKDMVFSINKGDVLDICRNEAMNLNSIVAYIRYLYEKYESSRRKYGFCHPGIFNRADNTGEMVTEVARRLKERLDDQVILLPYNPGYHWILIVIDMTETIVYHVDSLRRNPDLIIRTVVNSAIRATNITNGKRGETSWQCIECPKQEGSVECGYFTMLFMKHFYENPNQSVKTKILELKRITYTTAELDKVRYEFIEFIEQFIG